MHVTPIFHATIILQIILEFVLFISSTPLNPNPVKHFRVRFTAKKEGQITPCLKLVRIILETWNLVCKYTHRKICLIWQWRHNLPTRRHRQFFLMSYFSYQVKWLVQISSQYLYWIFMDSINNPEIDKTPIWVLPDIFEF